MKFTHTAIDGARNRAVTLFKKYRHTIHPCPFKFEDFYWFAWTREEQAALRLLKDRDAIDNGSRMTIRCKALKNKREWLEDDKVVFSHPDGYSGWPYPSVEFTDEAITNPVLKMEFLRWVVKAKQLRFYNSLFERYVRQVTHYGWVEEGKPGPLNTIGQLYRVWPEYASLADHKYRDRVANQKLKSALPKFWDEEHVKAIQSRPHLEEINAHLLAMSIMEDDVEIDRDYPDL